MITHEIVQVFHVFRCETGKTIMTTDNRTTAEELIAYLKEHFPGIRHEIDSSASELRLKEKAHDT